MEKFIINGGKQLHGEVEISGAKNAAVAVIPATILAGDICRIENIPDIRDVQVMLKILSDMGAVIHRINKNTLEIDTRYISSYVIPYEMTKYSRSSYYLLGALLGRYNHAKVAMPGGCNFGGVRPIDFHLKGFAKLGAEITNDNGMINAQADHLTGGVIYFDKVSVGATVNIMLAAVKADGLTIIENAAKEPHIVDLANFLNLMGANVRGAGTDVIRIKGVSSLHGCSYSIIPDQIEAGTYMVAAAAVKGDILIKNVIPKHLESITAKLRECGVSVIEYDDSIRVTSNSRCGQCKVTAMPHPGFPTDMQPQMTTFLATCSGTSIVTDGVWDNRFRYVDQLISMGASIQIEGKAAIITGVPKLHGAPIRADDLRAGAAMLIAGMCAEGTTVIENIYHIERGYERVTEKLTALGADIKKVDVCEDDNSKSVSDAG
ncbi:MAG: UDP-N-acetylglucosamine 1-carboxyvinyltransferase [Clostridiales bacterium]|nr:UDP-N-acetylglucosamine 1-carboxyvinyltransferase [Clostridiales bacterium]